MMKALLIFAPVLLPLVAFGETPPDLHAEHRAPVAATFECDRKPLHPEFWTAWEAPVNRERIFDFYAKQAEWALAQPQMPALLSEYPGLDSGTHGHWGNQNEEVWRDGRWNDTEIGSVVSGVVRGAGKTVVKGVCVQLGGDGKMACCFNPQTLTFDLVWSGGFVRYNAFRHGIGQGVEVAGDVCRLRRNFRRREISFITVSIGTVRG